MLRLTRWRRRVGDQKVGGYCVLSFPDSAESRWLDQIPTPGTRIRDHGERGYWGRVWVVDEVMQSGAMTYIVFCVGWSQYRDNLRYRAGGELDMADKLLDLARLTRETVAEGRRRRKYRDYMP